MFASTSEAGVRIEEPASRAGGTFAIVALQDLAVGLAAYSSELTKAGLCKPIYYEREFATRTPGTPRN
jgi:hypothetical protein